MNPHYQTTIRTEFARVGVTDYAFEHGGKHPRVVYSWNGERLMYVFPSSPSDSIRGVKNMLADLRRQLGVAAPKRVRSTRPRRTKAAVAESEMPESFVVRGDPWDALREILG